MLIRWQEASAFDFPGPEAVGVLVVGSTEQHSEYLPLGTDSYIGGWLAEDAAKKASGTVVLLPVQGFGFSHHHRAFPGLITLGQETLFRLLVDVCRSVRASGLRKLLLINSHGGNQSCMQCAVNELGAEGQDLLLVRYWDLVAEDIARERKSGLGGMGHAGELETALMLHYGPQWVRQERIGQRGAAQGGRWHHPDMFARNQIYRYRPFDEYSEKGNIGQPQYATAQQGERWAGLITDRLAELIDDYAQQKIN